MKLDLNQVFMPKKVPELIEKDIARIVLKMKAKGTPEEDIKKFEEDSKWNKVDKLTETIQTAIGIYCEAKYSVGNEKLAIPMNIRKQIAKIVAATMESEGGIFELGNDEVKFLIDVLNSDLPNDALFVYISDYLEEEYLKNKSK